jgi:hypothetical protein
VNRRNSFTVSLIVLAIGTTTPMSADNWPQWRGPQLNGTTVETNLPIRWSKSDGVAWTLPLPAWSGSTPIIWADRIFLTWLMDRRYLCGAWIGLPVV